MRVLVTCLLLLATLPGWAAETLLASGTGAGNILLENLARLYHGQKGLPEGHRLEVLMPPLGSNGALRALRAGRIDLAIIGREPLPAEGSFLVTELASTPLVFAGRDRRKPTGMSHRDLVDIYAGRRSTWDDGTPLRLVLRAPFESDTLTLGAIGPEMKAAVESALHRKAGPIGENDLDTIELLSTLPGSFGPTTLGLLRLLQRDLPTFDIEGISPGIEALESGRYPLSKRLYIVTRPQHDTATQAFLAFVRSPAAQELLRRTGHLPAARR